MMASTKDILRLEIGVFLHEFVQHLKSIVNGKTPSGFQTFNLSTQHTVAYSAHDSDVTFLLAAFGVYDGKLVAYSSSVVLELYGPSQPGLLEQFSLQLLYKRGFSDPDGKYLQFPVCSDRPPTSGCPLNLVMKQIEPLLLDPADFQSTCAAVGDTHFMNAVQYIVSYSTSPFFILIMLSCVLVMLCLTWLFIYQRYKNRTRNSEIFRFAHLHSTA
ncbi:hypothetical protein PHET_07473 [Paragonimus heterotremus]|uniref:Lysosomal acid phosphatase n=1 Tax=Paragonimus heterotremus TaxID=100268 RepID=A0A8J4SXT8_9TREM|nr:hypothetical protein PHET_07473 [Paragonimus heterotremus]